MLCNMKELLTEAEKENRAVGSFSVHSMKNVKGVIRAAEESETPVIIQIAEARLIHAPLHLMAPMMLAATSDAKVRLAGAPGSWSASGNHSTGAGLWIHFCDNK